METGLLVILVMLLVGIGAIGYRVIYPTEVQLKNIPALTLTPPAPLQLSEPAPLQINTEGKQLDVSASGVSIPLKGPEKIDLAPSAPLKIDYGIPPTFSFNEPPPINFGNPPMLSVAEIPSLKVNSIPSLEVSEIPPLKFSTPPSLNLNPRTLDVAPIPPIRWASELPKMQFGEVPVMKLVKSNPCEGIGGNYRDVGTECYNYLWREAGCSSIPEYTDWHQKRTRNELIADANIYAAGISDPEKRAKCYGENWFDYAPNEVFVINHPKNWYAPREYWTPILNKMGWRLATTAELYKALGQGAEWCASAFLADGPNAWPMQTAKSGCGGPGLSVWTPANGTGSATVYGKKPPKSQATTADYVVSAFNQSRNRWSVYDRPTLAPRNTCDYSKAEYLRLNPDVAAAKMDAWTHYTTYGKNEMAANPNRKWPGRPCPLDAGYPDRKRGWFDMQNQGVNNDYCRWVGDASNPWFSCVLAGSELDITPREVSYSDNVLYERI